MVDYRDKLGSEEDRKGLDIRYILLYIMITAFTVLMLLDTLG
jgi:hypothetical protein